jgi:hypothetical protein
MSLSIASAILPVNDVLKADWEKQIRHHAFQIEQAVRSRNFGYIHNLRAQRVARGIDYAATLRVALDGVDEVDHRLARVSIDAAEDHQFIFTEYTDEVRRLPDNQQDKDHWRERVHERSRQAEEKLLKVIHLAAEESIFVIGRIPLAAQHAATSFFFEAFGYLENVIETVVKQIDQVFIQVVDYIRGVWIELQTSWEIVNGTVRTAVEAVRNLIASADLIVEEHLRLRYQLSQLNLKTRFTGNERLGRGEVRGRLNLISATRDGREVRDSRDERDFRDIRDSRDVKEIREDRESRDIRDYRDYKDVKDIKEFKDIKDIKDIRDIKDIKDIIETKDIRDVRDIKDIKDIIETKDIRDVKDIKDVRDVRDSRDYRDVKDVRDSRDYRDVKDVRDSRDYRDVKDVRDSRDYRDVKDFRDTRDVRDTRDIRDTRDVRDERDYRSFKDTREDYRDSYRSDFRDNFKESLSSRYNDRFGRYSRTSDVETRLEKVDERLEARTILHVGRLYYPIKITQAAALEDLSRLTANLIRRGYVLYKQDTEVDELERLILTTTVFGPGREREEQARDEEYLRGVWTEVVGELPKGSDLDERFVPSLTNAIHIADLKLRNGLSFRALGNELNRVRNGLGLGNGSVSNLARSYANVVSTANGYLDRISGNNGTAVH